MRTRNYTVLLCVLCVTALIAGAAAGDPSANLAQADQEDDDDDDYDGKFAVLQGDRCIALEPFGEGNQTVEEFYDYRTPETHDYPDYEYSSFGTTHLQEDDTSILFFYEGADGPALVLVHDQLRGDSPGGAVTMQLEGLPEEGEWVVEDDDYDDQSDRFQHGDTASRITWVYTDARNDGAAFQGGLDDEFEITIDAAFNGDADFSVYESQITDWQAVSAAGDNETERTSLDMDEPITVTSQSCASIDVTTVTTSPSEPAPGEEVDVQATIANSGDREGTFTAEFTADGEVIDERNVSLEGGETRQLTATTEFEDEGTYGVGVGNATVDVEVSEDESDGGTDAAGSGGDGDVGGLVDAAGDHALELGVAIALLAVLSVAGLTMRGGTTPAKNETDDE